MYKYSSVLKYDVYKEVDCSVFNNFKPQRLSHQLPYQHIRNRSLWKWYEWRYLTQSASYTVVNGLMMGLCRLEYCYEEAPVWIWLQLHSSMNMLLNSQTAILFDFTAKCAYVWSMHVHGPKALMGNVVLCPELLIKGVHIWATIMFGIGKVNWQCLRSNTSVKTYTLKANSFTFSLFKKYSRMWIF